ncbi:hypothetical protein D3C84_878030 [compost metagenome]
MDPADQLSPLRRPVHRPWPGTIAQRSAFCAHGVAGQRDHRKEHGSRRSLGDCRRGGLAPLPDAGLSPDRQRWPRRDPGQHRCRPVQRQEHHRPPGRAAPALLADDRSLRRPASVADHWRLRAGPRLHASRRDSRPGGAAEHSDSGVGRSAARASASGGQRHRREGRRTEETPAYRHRADLRRP